MYARRLDPSVLVISLSLHRHPFVCIIFSSHFTSYNKYILKFKPDLVDNEKTDTKDQKATSVYTMDTNYTLTDVSKCVWQERWCCWSLTLPVPTLLAHVCPQHTIPHSPHTHAPHFHVHSGSLVFCASAQDSCLRRDHPDIRITILSTLTTQCMWDV